jgi:DNA processing protein
MESAPTLQVRGSIAEHDRVVALVGSRAASARGTELAFALAREMAAAGALIVSGGALGIDAAAHRGALVAGGATAVVLGSGIDVVYPPQHDQLFADIASHGGAVMSPFADGTAPRPGCFVTRNRVIAALADIVVVVEASARSGALHTARAAAELGRVVGAVPGSAGCEALLARGAALVEWVDDIDAALSGAERRPAVAMPGLESDRGVVLQNLASDPADASEIAGVVGIEERRVVRALTELEIDGLAVAMPGRRYARSALAAELMAEDSRG